MSESGLSENYKVKVPCSKCGEQCYKLCYIRNLVVCVDCFRSACEKAEKNKKTYKQI